METTAHADTVSARPITPTDPGLEPSEVPRLSRQGTAMLAALLERPRWNYELAELGLSYARRLSDIRAAGFVVAIIARTDEGGRLYALQVGADQLSVPRCISDPAHVGTLLLYAPDALFISWREAQAWGLK